MPSPGKGRCFSTDRVNLPIKVGMLPSAIRPVTCQRNRIHGRNRCSSSLCTYQPEKNTISTSDQTRSCVNRSLISRLDISSVLIQLTSTQLQTGAMAFAIPVMKSSYDIYLVDKPKRCRYHSTCSASSCGSAASQSSRSSECSLRSTLSAQKLYESRWDLTNLRRSPGKR